MKRWLLGLLGLPMAVHAGQMTEIVYEDSEPGQPAYISRNLILGERLRLDMGQDDGDYILYDRQAKMVYQVARSVDRITEIPAAAADVRLPTKWQVAVKESFSDGNRLRHIDLNGHRCAQVRSAKLLGEAARMLGDFRRSLAGIQARTWQATPEELRDPCVLLLEGVKAGIEYDAGFPLAVDYADGRRRSYRSHAVLADRPELFRLPEGYARFRIGR